MSKYEKLLDIINNSNSEILFFTNNGFNITHKYSDDNFERVSIISYYSDGCELFLYTSLLEYISKIDKKFIFSLLQSFFEEKYNFKPKIIIRS